MRWLLVTGILILTSFVPMASHAESENDFEKGYFDKDGDGKSKSGDNYLTLRYERLVPLLVQAIKELSSEVKELKEKINEEE